MEAILKGKVIKSVDDFHREIRKILDLPDYYGNNLDALWDCLTGWIEMPLTLIWEDFENSKAILGVFADKALALFQEAEKEVQGFKIICL
jgi:ribonuclease inhibitor